MPISVKTSPATLNFKSGRADTAPNGGSNPSRIAGLNQSLRGNIVLPKHVNHVLKENPKCHKQLTATLHR